jgi:hypothetical protein
MSHWAFFGHLNVQNKPNFPFDKMPNVTLGVFWAFKTSKKHPIPHLTKCPMSHWAFFGHLNVQNKPNFPFDKMPNVTLGVFWAFKCPK